MCQLWALHVVTKRQFFYIYLLYDGASFTTSLASYLFRISVILFEKMLVKPMPVETDS